MALRRQLFATLFLVMLLKADDLIVPGVRVGPVSRASTERSLLASLGKAAVKEDVAIGEGMTEPGLVIYKNDPARRLAVIWNDEKPAHPATVFICYDALEPAPPCRWHTAGGIGMGTPLKELERRNGGPFEMTGWGFDLGGNIVSFGGGNLERELRGTGALGLTLYPRTNQQGEYVPKIADEEFNAVQGDQILKSSDPILQKLNPRVIGMSLDFPRK